jgi:hypothetical protein
MRSRRLFCISLAEKKEAVSLLKKQPLRGGVDIGDTCLCSPLRECLCFRSIHITFAKYVPTYIVFEIANY